MASALFKKSPPIDKEREEFRIEQLLAWESSQELKERFPYHLTGVDKLGNPVYIIEFGLWDIRKLTEDGGDLLIMFDKYLEQMLRRFQTSPLNYPNSSQQFVITVNMTGYSKRQMGSLKSLQKISNIARTALKIFSEKDNLRMAFLVNCPAIFQPMWKILRPLLGHLASKTELFSTDTDKWQPVLFEQINRDQLPADFGGSKVTKN